MPLVIPARNTTSDSALVKAMLLEKEFPAPTKITGNPGTPGVHGSPILAGDKDSAKVPPPGIGEAPPSSAMVWILLPVGAKNMPSAAVEVPAVNVRFSFTNCTVTPRLVRSSTMRRDQDTACASWQRSAKRPVRPVGDISMLTRMAAVVSVRARGELEVIDIPAKEFRLALSDFTTLAEKIINAFVQRRQWLESLQDFSGVLHFLERA